MNEPVKLTGVFTVNAEPLGGPVIVTVGGWFVAAPYRTKARSEKVASSPIVTLPKPPATILPSARTATPVAPESPVPIGVVTRPLLPNVSSIEPSELQRITAMTEWKD